MILYLNLFCHQNRERCLAIIRRNLKTKTLELESYVSSGSSTKEMNEFLHSKYGYGYHI